MRITKEQAKANRDLIVQAAASLFRLRGFDGIGVADLLKSAGFTHGGLYNHFKSKDELAAAAADLAFRNLDEETAQQDSVQAILKRYISRDHRDELRTGCPAAALGGEAAHQSDQIKQVFEAGIEQWIKRLEDALAKEGKAPGKTRRDLAVNLLSTAVGSVVLSRASSTNAALSDEILDACLHGALADVERQ